MKATVVAAAAAILAGGASAGRAHGHRHAHALFEKRGEAADEVCTPGCSTIYSTITGEITLLPPAPTSTSVAPAPEPTTTGPITVPTPIPQTCPTPGTYTFPATTIVVTETTTVCGGTPTEVPSGTHTLGGVTTVVETATTVVCPVATTETQDGVVTSVIKTTTFVCPSAGTYTIAPITTVVPSVTTVVVPVVETYCPGTYTAPAVVTTVTETNEQINALKSWSEWDLVDLCVVGNEALFNGFCSVSELTSLIGRTKSELASVGYNGPFTTTDVVSAWIDNDVSAICSVIDVVATNAHAYFNSATKPADAGKFVAGQLAIVEKVCNKPGYVMETGWPSAGNCNGVACAGPTEQREAIESIERELGNKVVFFSFRNDEWKQPGECNCERSWGCAAVWGV
uniref:Probable beta-glucosidase btgE n=1 Tax=Chaetomium globosum TaxID=38033 RepID=A0A2D1QUI6_CHAGS|nr:exo-beta-1,3-glucanase [Chaetomium globosum]